MRVRYQRVICGSAIGGVDLVVGSFFGGTYGCGLSTTGPYSSVLNRIRHHSAINTTQKRASQGCPDNTQFPYFVLQSSAFEPQTLGGSALTGDPSGSGPQRIHDYFAFRLVKLWRLSSTQASRTL